MAVYGDITELFSTPYLTIAEYKQAPTSIDVDNLVSYSTDPAVQNAELANVIARASSWIDTYCNQVLAATTTTERQRLRMSPDGYIKVHPDYWPVVAVTSFSYGATPNGLATYPDLSQAWIEKQSIVVPWTAGNMNWSSAGPLNLGMAGQPRGTVFCEYTYVNGYANTTLAASSSAGASSITVADSTGIVPNSKLTIYDGLNTENVTVSSTYTPGSTTVTLARNAVNAHSSGVCASALPPAIKQAAILATTAFLKVRGDSSLTMAVTDSVSSSKSGSQYTGEDLALAEELLKPFRRNR
jgi:hypothetical protein